MSVYKDVDVFFAMVQLAASQSLSMLGLSQPHGKHRPVHPLL